jgi:uncharacterized protein (DUF736 family)
MRMRRTVLAVVLSAGVLVPTVSTAAAAWAKPASKPTVTHKGTPKPAKAPAKSAKPAKPAKVNFAASGSVTAVNLDAGTVTVAAKGGTKDVKGTSVTVVVPSTARIVLDDASATLADLAAGYRITVTGTHVGTAYTATKVQASSPEPVEEPTDEPTDEPTA